ncbi:MAG: hypothetical protein RR998_09030 [Oscillospiraceae bacterium]
MAIIEVNPDALVLAARRISDDLRQMDDSIEQLKRVKVSIFDFGFSFDVVRMRKARASLEKTRLFLLESAKRYHGAHSRASERAQTE